MANEHGKDYYYKVINDMNWIKNLEKFAIESESLVFFLFFIFIILKVKWSSWRVAWI